MGQPSRIDSDSVGDALPQRPAQPARKLLTDRPQGKAFLSHRCKVISKRGLFDLDGDGREKTTPIHANILRDIPQIEDPRRSKEVLANPRQYAGEEIGVGEPTVFAMGPKRVHLTVTALKLRRLDLTTGEIAIGCVDLDNFGFEGDFRHANRYRDSGMTFPPTEGEGFLLDGSA